MSLKYYFAYCLFLLSTPLFFTKKDLVAIYMSSYAISLNSTSSAESLDNLNVLAQQNISKISFNVSVNDANVVERHIITTFFKGVYHKKRVEELIFSLKRNINLKSVSKVHILWEDVNPLTLFNHSMNHKIKLLRLNMQPTYQKLFEYANSILPQNSIAIIANADIYFDKTLECLRPSANKTVNKMIALTRRHSPRCGKRSDHKGIRDLCLHYIGSHDAFLFKIPLKVSKDMLNNLNFTQNVGMGVENRVLYEFQRAEESYRYKVYNPCQLIHGFHLHCSGERTYKRKGIHISQAKYNNGTRKHGWVKPWWYRREHKCPFYL